MLLALAVLAVTAAGDAVPLTIDGLLDIRHPSRATWSPDGRRVAYVWDKGGVQDVYRVDATGGEPKPLTRHAAGSVDGLFWSADGRSVLFERNGDLWQVDAEGGAEPRAVWTTPAAESEIALSHDGKQVAFVRDGDLWVRSLQDGRETRLTQTPEAESGPVWSGDDARLAFSVVTSRTEDEFPDYVGGKIGFRRQTDFQVHVAAIPVAGGASVAIAKGDGTETAPRWLDGRRLSLQRETPDLKSREVVVADVVSGEARVVHRDDDAKFWSLTYLEAEPVPSPDGRSIAFVSDRDGRDHLYVVPAAGGPAIQITHGRYDVARPAWSPDSKRIAFDSNEGENPGARHLVVAEIGANPAKARLAAVTGGRGTSVAAAWSPDGTRLLYQRTDPQNPADLYVSEARPAAAARRLTDSLPKSIDRARFVEPQLVHYASRDGQSVPAYLFVPRGLDRTKPHPAIVWVHGDGINQNYDGWHIQRNYAVYYSFHQYLIERGYVVLAVDYRGSIGYGRDWRQGHYRDLGGRDYEDIAAGVDYLGGLGFVDRTRVGIWGLSYGGFMALQALTVTPELFRCAIDVAGVDDWRDWYHDPDGPWIRGRMGRPEENPELYDRLSPIHGVDRIVRPLLVLHGTADVNVPFIESVRLVDALLKAGKDVEFAIYPGEYHYFQRSHVLRDAWHRAERFFDGNLRAAP